VDCYIWYSEEGTGGAAAHPGPSTVMAHPATASVTITYNGALLCNYNVPIKG